MSQALSPPLTDASLPAAEALPPLSVYVHLPWCIRKCPYCDFNSHRAPERLLENEYVDALLRDIDAESPASAGRVIASVFIGGGTPSLFSGEAVTRLLNGLRARLPLAADAEVTLEANPGASDAARFAAYRRAGVNRLSIGVQSFRDGMLAALGRVHAGGDAVSAAGAAREAGFDNVNLDLMYALPADSVDGALQDLTCALDLEPTHVSWYQLTLEPGTQFYRRPPALLPNEDTTLEIEARGRDLLARHGYRRYEVSAYAQAGRRCRHNLSYWTFGDYLGIGAGAHGKLTCAVTGAIERRAKTRNPLTYIDAAGTPEAVTVEHTGSPSALALEFLMNALRLQDGFRIADFETRTRRPLASFAEAFGVAFEHGWLERRAGRIRATADGYRRLNAVLELFVPPAEEVRTQTNPRASLIRS